MAAVEFSAGTMRPSPIIIHGAIWLGLWAVTGWCWITSKPVDRNADRASGIVLREGIVYRTAGGYRAMLDVYLPAETVGKAARPPRPAVLAIHGGSWSGGSKRRFRSGPESATVLRLAAAGFVVIAVDYRLARPGSPSWPAALDDVREAVRWTRRHAQELGIDPDRIAALGQSSGAHLAAMLGTRADPADWDGVSARVRAVINFYGPSDLVRLAAWRHLPYDPVQLFLGSTLAPEASPIHCVTHESVPMLLLHGSDDAWVPLEQAKQLAQALRNAGVMHRLIVVEGARHGFEALVNDPKEPQRVLSDLLPEIFAFLETVWNVGSR